MEAIRKKKEKVRIEKLIVRLEKVDNPRPTSDLVHDLIGLEKKKRSLIKYEDRPGEVDEIPKELFTNDWETRNQNIAPFYRWHEGERRIINQTVSAENQNLNRDSRLAGESRERKKRLFGLKKWDYYREARTLII
jgi:hypothetical protein